MSENNGWPGEPGVPLNPEKSGWHWVKGAYSLSEPRLYFWDVFWGLGQWADERLHDPMMLAEMKYIRPAFYYNLTPAEVDARIATARKDALEKCISICNAVAHANRVEYPAKWKDRPEGIPHDWQQAWETCAETAEDIAADIRALAKGEGDD
jgi:hypothetical protein